MQGPVRRVRVGASEVAMLIEMLNAEERDGRDRLGQVEMHQRNRSRDRIIGASSAAIASECHAGQHRGAASECGKYG
jgi:hypothetical protein